MSERKFALKKSKVIIPIMVIVAVLASIILSQEEYNEVTIINKILIALGAAIVSSLLGYILLKPDIDKVDPKPETNQTNTGNKKKGSGK